MIKANFKDGVLVFQVSVVPRASRSEIVGSHNDMLRVRIAAPPVDGAANAELVRLIAKKLSLPRNAVEIQNGLTSRVKTVRVTGVEPNALDSLT